MDINIFKIINETWKDYFGVLNDISDIMVKLEIYAADPYKPVIVKWFNKNDIVKLQ
jgi:hypothetical protein